MAASPDSIRAGGAHVEFGIDMTKLQAGLREAQARIQSWGAGMMRAGTAVAGVGLAMASPLAIAVEAASNAEETLNKFNAVFGTQSQAAEEFAQNLGGSLGRGITEIRDGMSAFQAQMVGLGFDPSQAREMSQQLTSLAYDFGSFFNVSDAESFQRFISAMSGSGEVLDRFGINIKQAALEQEFLAMGLSVSAANATEQQKAMARFRIIQRTLTQQGATGDALKTADSFANSWKRVRSQLIDVATTVGQAVLPAVTEVVRLASTGIGWFKDWVAENQSLVQLYARAAIALVGIGTALASIGAGVYLAGAAFGILSTVVSALGAVAAFALSPIGLGLIAGAVAAGILVGALYGAMQLSETFAGYMAAWIPVFERIGEVANQAFGGIAAAMQVGDLTSAAEIAWTAIQLLFAQGINWIRGTWLDLKFLFLETIATIGASLVDTFSAAWVTVQATFLTVWSHIKEQLFDTLAAAALAAARIAPTAALREQLQSSGGDLRNLATREQVSRMSDEERRAAAATAGVRVEDLAPALLGNIAEQAAAAQRERERERVRASLDRGREIQDERARALQEEDDLQRELTQQTDAAEMIAWFDEQVRLHGQTTPGSAQLPGAEGGAGKTDAIGSFSAAALAAQVGGSTIEERQLRAQEDARELLRRILDRVAEAGVIPGIIVE